MKLANRLVLIVITLWPKSSIKNYVNVPIDMMPPSPYLHMFAFCWKVQTTIEFLGMVTNRKARKI